MENGFLFYRSFYDAIKRLDANDFKECVTALCEYALDGTESELSPTAAMFFTLVRPNVDASNTRRAAGRKGGKANAEHFNSTDEANVKQTPSKREANAKQTEANAKQPSSKREPEEDKRYKDKRIEKENKEKETVDLSALIDDPELAEALSRWLDVRMTIGPYPYASITACIDAAKRAQAKFGTAACVEAIKQATEGAWKAIRWPTESARSGTTKKQNTFTGFRQNDYDFDELEKRLLEAQ